MFDNNFTAYFNYIKTKFNCWCCCTKPEIVQRPSEQEDTFDLRLEIHAHSHGLHRHRPDTPRPQPKTLTLD